VVDEPVDLPEGTVVDLVPVPQTAHPRPRFGSARGRVQMAPDFDAPLDDFADYVPMLLLVCGLGRVLPCALALEPDPPRP